MEMSRLTRDGTAEPVSRGDQILRHARGQGNIIFPVQLTTSRIGNLTRLIHTLLYVMTIHTYQTPPTIITRTSYYRTATTTASDFSLNSCCIFLAYKTTILLHTYVRSRKSLRTCKTYIMYFSLPITIL